MLEKARGQVGSSQILDDVVPRLVVGDQRGDAKAILERGARRHPPPPGVRFLRAVDDTQDRPAAGKRQAQVAAPPNVPRQDLDGDRIVVRVPRQRREAAVFGGNHVERIRSGRGDTGTRRHGATTSASLRHRVAASQRRFGHERLLACVRRTFLMWIGWFGRSLAPRGAAAILSATSMPETTSPKAEYWLSRKVESFTTMKNCEDAELGSCERAIETMPLLCEMSLSSALRRTSFPSTTLPPVP